MTQASSFDSESNLKLDYVNFNEDSAFIDKTLQKIAGHQNLITKRRNFTFYFRILIVSILSSLYYCLILSMDQEIELVTAKIFHSIIVFILTLIEHLLMRNKSESNFPEGNSIVSFSDNRYAIGNYQYENIRKRKYSNNYEEIDRKEMYFYNVIYGMLSFICELQLYYFLSLSSSFNVNIGTMYTLTVMEFLILIIRLPYLKVSLGIFQCTGTVLILIFTSILFYRYVPDYNIIVIIFTSITVSIFKFIKFSIFEYIHNKTKNANKLIRQSSYFDGMIGILLVVFIISSRNGELLIQDLGNFMKVLLASFFYYFALKISIYNEKHYYLYVIFSSLNFIFITLFDYLINKRSSTLLEFSLISSLSLFSICSFIQDSAFTKGLKKLFY